MTTFIVITDNGVAEEQVEIASRFGMYDAACQRLAQIGITAAGAMKGHYHGTRRYELAMPELGLSVNVYRFGEYPVVAGEGRAI